MTNTKYKNPLTVRKTEEMEEMLDFLQKKAIANTYINNEDRISKII